MRLVRISVNIWMETSGHPAAQPGGERHLPISQIQVCTSEDCMLLFKLTDFPSVIPMSPPGAIIARETKCRRESQCSESANINIIPSGLNK